LRGRQKPGGQLDWLVVLQLARLFAATLGGVVVIYLVIDFADRAHTFSGRAWGRAAAELYMNKAAVAAYQLAPAALIIAAALFVTQLARRGELIALFSLGIRPLRLAVPAAAFSSVLGIALFVLGEKVVVRADARAEEIQVKRFNRWGDWGTYHVGSSWVRGKDGRIFHLGSPTDGGFEPVTVLEIAPPFRLARRIDARRIEPAANGWRLIDAVETRYAVTKAPGGEIFERRADVLEESFPETPHDFELASGRPRQLSWNRLREQLERRRAAGLVTREYEVTLAERAAQPVQPVPAALAAMGLAMQLQRPRRRMPLAGAVALGLGLSMLLWAVSVIAHALAMAASVPTWASGVVPFLASSVIAVVSFRRG
jgi:lipopolysaccharide export system permease protein